jgi:hypothetical protein
MGGHTEKDGPVDGQAGQNDEVMDGAVLEGDLQPPRPRRGRFQRPRRSTAEEHAGAGESLASLHAELVLLREENARLKAAQHQSSDIGRLLGRARSLSSAKVDRDGLTDETAQMLVDGLVIRESLLEICQEIERSMVAFEAKLSALALAAADHTPPTGIDQANGNGSNHA